jgi:hypothetical protein
MTNTTADELTLVPTGAGNPRTLPKTGLHYEWAEFFPDGQRVLLFASEPGHGLRLLVQALDGGKPQPITKEEQHLAPAASHAIGPDGRIAVTDGNGRVFLLPSEGGEPQAVPGTKSDENVLGWGADGRSLYLGGGPVPVRIEICDTMTGVRRLWKEIVPPDPAGVLTIGPILIARDGRSLVYSYRRQLDELVLVTGLK